MVGFDIGGTKCAVTVGEIQNGTLRILKKKVMPTDHGTTPYKMIDRMCRTAMEMTNDFSYVGISCGGPLDSHEGVILSPPNLPGWDHVEIVRFVEEKLGGKVALQNDANACALAEWRYGAGRGCRNMIFLTFGTGLGAGLILGGQLYEGTNDMAGEVGHLRLSAFGPIGYGKSGSFEGFCSGSGLAQLGKIYATEQLQKGNAVSYCKDRSELSQVNAKKLAQYAYDGEEDACRVYEICGEKLGEGLAFLVDILNPEKIILGSIYQRSEQLLKKAMLRTLRAEALPRSLEVCEIVPAALGDQIGDYAALSVAAEQRNGE